MKKAIFLLKYDLNWLGGVYYKLHLIRALRSFNSGIGIVVYTESANKAAVEELVRDYNVKVKAYDRNIPRGFGRLELFFRKKLNFSLFGLFDKDLLMNNRVFDYDSTGVLRVVPSSRRIYWIPDLQDLYLPQLFSSEAISIKRKRYTNLANTARMLVFSSNDSYNSFREHFPQSVRDDLRIFILRFAVFHPLIDTSKLPAIHRRFGVESFPYFIVSNQFMAHKNHSVVIDALSKIKTEYGLTFKVIFTGKTEDPRNPHYFSSLERKIEAAGLQDDIIITGVIEREEQLLLMKNAVAVIQPSLFEGWNSTVEDAKLLGSNLICSDLPVHREQLEGCNSVLFPPEDSTALAQILHKIYLEGMSNCKSAINYSENQRQFSEAVESIFIS